MIMIVDIVGFTPTYASNLLMIFGIASVVIGYITIKFLDFNNKYIGMTIKYVVRLGLFILTILTNNTIILLVTIAYLKCLGDSYQHITESPYINRYKGNEQLSFNNLREMVSYFGRGIGTLICGALMIYGYKYNFVVAAIFLALQNVFMFMARKNLDRENDR